MPLVQMVKNVQIMQTEYSMGESTTTGSHIIKYGDPEKYFMTFK